MTQEEKRHQILPDRREDPKISDMIVGESAYTVKWGMWVDHGRRCWLHPDYTVQASPFGTANMRIELRENGYHVWAPPGATWEPREKPGYYSPADTKYIPVLELHDVHRTR